MNRSHRVASGVALSLVAAILALLWWWWQPQPGLAHQPEPTPSPEPPGDLTALAVSTGPLPLVSALHIGPTSISGSSVHTESCYDPAKTQILCFTVTNGSTDAEWLDRVRLTFPQAQGNWTVSCSSQDAVDSSGSSVHMACSTPHPYEVVYADNETEPGTPIGEITMGSSWGFCVSATVPPAYSGPRIINWGLSGDEEPGSAEPHEIEGQIEIGECMPLMLKPAAIAAEGCNGIAQTHVFELWNNTGSPGAFSLAYSVSGDRGTFSGPTSLSLAAGETVSLTAELEPSLFLQPGEQITATLHVQGNGQSDSSQIVHTITELAGWGARGPASVPSMDQVVVWASHADGGLWTIGGYGSQGATQRYDPGTDSWTVHASEVAITPTIEYPMDGCYGLNADGDEVVVLFPDTIVTGSLHIYNITTDAWYLETVPAFYPEEGRWGQDVVSLLNVPGVNENVCYMSGGSTMTGGGRTKNLWVYDPATNSGQWLGNFLAQEWFAFHASWYVPWVGDEGAICVGGGVDLQSNVIDSTQCYDLHMDQFNAPNADLGPLPEPWWGMADGWQVYDGRYQIWIANGVSQNGALLPASAYRDQTMGGFSYGPAIPVSAYRLEGEGVDGQFVILQGARGGFNYGDAHLLLAQCPSCIPAYLPIALRAYGP